MMDGSSTRSEDDLKRLREAYERRRQSSIQPGEDASLDPGIQFILRQRRREIAALLQREGCLPIDGRRVLELGCGSGRMLREMLEMGASPSQLHGIDLLHWRLMEARASLQPLASSPVSLISADGRHLPYPDQSFDLVLQFTAFTSMLDDRIKRAVAAEMLRVLTPEGLILWYDFWLNPLNRQTKGIRPTEIRSLFPRCRFDFRRITLAPPIARRLASLSPAACARLESLTIFNSHFLVGIRRE